MTLRLLADAAAKIPLSQHLNGFVTLNGTFNDMPRAFVLDTTLRGLTHTCKYQWLPFGISDDYNETCPLDCTSDLTIPLLSSKEDTVDVDPFAANLTVAGLSIATFTSGRICDNERFEAFTGVGAMANAVFGIGPGQVMSFANGTAALDTIPWSSYSIYLTKIIQDPGSFLLPGGGDAEWIATQALTETKLPATTEKGWTVDLDAFSMTGASLQAACSPTAPCKVTVATASPVIQLGKDLWNSVLAGIDKRSCRKTYVGDYFLYECYDTAKLPTLSFKFGWRTFTLNKTEYSVPIPKSETLSVHVMVAADNRNLPYTSEWILDGVFPVRIRS